MELSGFSRVLASRESLFSLHFHFFFFISFSTTKDVEQLPSGNGRMLAISELYFQIYAKPYQKIQRQINFVLKKNSTMIIKALCPYLKVLLIAFISFSQDHVHTAANHELTSLTKNTIIEDAFEETSSIARLQWNTNLRGATISRAGMKVVHCLSV